MAFVSKGLHIDMSATFQEAQLQANTIDESILYLDNLHTMSYVSSGGKDTQVNPDNSFEYSKEGISFFNFQINLNTSLLDNFFSKATMQPLQLCLDTPQYLLYTDTKTVQLLVSTIISIPKKDHFSFFRGGKPYNTVFPTTPETLSDKYNPVREDQY